MATNAGRFNNITLEAASAVGQFELVTVTASGAAKAGSASTTVPIAGVAVNSVDPSATPATTTLTTQVEGIAMVKAGAAVAKGAVVGSNGSGKAVTAATNNQFTIGVALEAASGADEIISVLILPSKFHS